MPWNRVSLTLGARRAGIFILFFLFKAFLCECLGISCADVRLLGVHNLKRGRGWAPVREFVSGCQRFIL